MLVKETIEMRQMYAQTLTQLAQNDPEIIALEADLASAMSMTEFATLFPRQFINCGIMEAQMVTTAAGLALLGKKVFLHTFGAFATRRCLDQLYVSLAYAHLPAVVIGSDAGITAEHNGGTHMPLEDIGVMRLIPQSIVLEASDSTMLGALVIHANTLQKLTYIRTIRKQAYKLYDTTDSFPIGGSKILRTGSDGVIFASGIMVAKALYAAEMLQQKNCSLSVVDCYSIKPIDVDTVVDFAKKTGKVIACDNHNALGGLGSAIAQTLMQHNTHCQFAQIGVKEQFGQVGTADYLADTYQLTAAAIVDRYRSFN